MATTAQQVFDIAIGLMSADTNGLTETSDTLEYKNRTLLILNALRGELYPYSDTYARSEGGTRPTMLPISDFDTPINLDDYIAQTVMPYGLAAHLLIDENPTVAAFFQQRYEELLDKLGSVPAEFEPIEDVYGGIGFSYGGRW
jgi:hypothetical protein